MSESPLVRVARRSACALAALLLAACASPFPPPATEPSPGDGCIIAGVEDARSLARLVIAQGQVVINVHDGGRGPTLPLQVTPRFGPGFVGPYASITKEDSSSLVHVRFVKPGTYSIGPHFIAFHRLGSTSWITPKSFRPTFEVLAGRCTYIGRTTLHPKDFSFSWSDAMAEDVAAAKALIPAALLREPPLQVAPHTIPELVPMN